MPEFFYNNPALVSIIIGGFTPIIIVGAFFVSLDIVIFIYNSTIAAACGLAQWNYIPLNSP